MIAMVAPRFEIKVLAAAACRVPPQRSTVIPPLPASTLTTAVAGREKIRYSYRPKVKESKQSRNNSVCRLID